MNKGNMRRQTIFNDNFWKRMYDANIRSMVHCGLMARNYEDLQKKYDNTGDLSRQIHHFRALQDEYLKMAEENMKHL